MLYVLPWGGEGYREVANLGNCRRHQWDLPRLWTTEAFRAAPTTGLGLLLLFTLLSLLTRTEDVLLEQNPGLHGPHILLCSQHWD